MVDIAKRFIQTFKKLPVEKQEYYGVPFLEAMRGSNSAEASPSISMISYAVNEVCLSERLFQILGKASRSGTDAN